MTAANENHTPVHSVRMPDDRWERLGEVYGERGRSAALNEAAAYLLREPGARLPARAAE